MAAAIILPVTVMNSAQADKPYEINVTFDNVSYDEGDTITITSTINYPPPIDAHFDIYDPDGILVYSGIETMFIEKPFTHSFLAGNNTLGIDWITGNYTAIGWYDANLGENATGIFEYTEEPRYRYDLYEETTGGLPHLEVFVTDFGDGTKNAEIVCDYIGDYRAANIQGSYLSVFFIGLDDEISYEEIDHAGALLDGDYDFVIPGDYHISCLFLDGRYNWIQADYFELSVLDS